MSQVNLQGVLMGMLAAFLFLSVVGGSIVLLGGYYSTSGYEEEDIDKYNGMTSLATDINNAYNEVDTVTPDPNVFDFFSDIYSKVITPFKFIYRSFATMLGMTTDLVGDLNLMPVFAEWLMAVLTVLIIIGIVLIKFYMNRQK